MKRKSISTAEFMRHFGRYHDEAQKSPITLTRHGRPSVVVMPVELFEKMLGRDDPRRSYAAGEMPDELAAMFSSQLDEDSDAYRESRSEPGK
ncbi:MULTISPECIES: type II toxin-antitoxin system Phd/YefM family antitoxin [Agrobacterium]|nr:MULTISPECIES: type II toxin-antitoxin system Phd/YefM family antitoxin [Agrobacterium]